MKKILIAITLAISLSGCAAFAQFKNPISTNNLAEIESSYGIILSAAVSYRNLRLCKKTEMPTFTNVCAKRSVVLQLQQADQNVQIALKEFRDFTKANPMIDTSAAISAIKSAVNVFKQIAADNGVK